MKVYNLEKEVEKVFIWDKFIIVIWNVNCLKYNLFDY